MRDWFRVMWSFASLPIAAAVALSPSATLGCGYDDDVSVARGLLNWIYPDALYVVGAMTAAVAEHQLPPPNFNSAKPDLFGSGYRKTVESLEQFGTALSSASREVPPPSFSLVLVEPMLWTRFEMTQHEWRTHVHVTGPAPGDLIVVSGEAAVGEIAHGGLTIGQARDLGFIRLYGTEEQQAAFVRAYRSVGREPAAGLGRTCGESACGPGHHESMQPLLGESQ